MRISVNFERCESHGLCVFAAPGVFGMDDDGTLDYDPTPAPAHAEAVRNAAAGCPNGAIRIEAG